MLPAKQGAPFRDQYQSPQPKGKSAQQLICLISENGWRKNEGRGINKTNAEEWITQPTKILGINKGKVTQIEKSNAIELALTEHGEIFARGTDTRRDAILGLGKGIFECKEFKQILSLQSKKIVNISLGSTHACAVDDQGVLYSWGRGSNGLLAQLNSSTDSIKEVSLNSPSEITLTDLKGKVKEVICRNNTTNVLTKKGNIIILGQISKGDIAQTDQLNQTKKQQKKEVQYSWSTFVKLCPQEQWGGCALTTKGEIVFYNKYFMTDKLKGKSSIKDIFASRDKLFALVAEGILEWDLNQILTNAFFQSKQKQTLGQSLDCKFYPPKLYEFCPSVRNVKFVVSPDGGSLALCVENSTEDVFTDKDSKWQRLNNQKGSGEQLRINISGLNSSYSQKQPQQLNSPTSFLLDKSRDQLPLINIVPDNSMSQQNIFSPRNPPKSFLERASQVQAAPTKKTFLSHIPELQAGKPEPMLQSQDLDMSRSRLSGANYEQKITREFRRVNKEIGWQEQLEKSFDWPGKKAVTEQSQVFEESQLPSRIKTLENLSTQLGGRFRERVSEVQATINKAALEKRINDPQNKSRLDQTQQQQQSQQEKTKQKRKKLIQGGDFEELWKSLKMKPEDSRKKMPSRQYFRNEKDLQYFLRLIQDGVQFDDGDMSQLQNMSQRNNKINSFLRAEQSKRGFNDMMLSPKSSFLYDQEQRSRNNILDFSSSDGESLLLKSRSNPFFDNFKQLARQNQDLQINFRGNINLNQYPRRPNGGKGFQQMSSNDYRFETKGGYQPRQLNDSSFMLGSQNNILSESIYQSMKANQLQARNKSRNQFDRAWYEQNNSREDLNNSYRQNKLSTRSFYQEYRPPIAQSLNNSAIELQRKPGISRNLNKSTLENPRTYLGGLEEQNERGSSGEVDNRKRASKSTSQSKRNQTKAHQGSGGTNQDKNIVFNTEWDKEEEREIDHASPSFAADNNISGNSFQENHFKSKRGSFGLETEQNKASKQNRHHTNEEKEKRSAQCMSTQVLPPELQQQPEEDAPENKEIEIQTDNCQFEEGDEIRKPREYIEQKDEEKEIVRRNSIGNQTALSDDKKEDVQSKHQRKNSIGNQTAFSDEELEKSRSQINTLEFQLQEKELENERLKKLMKEQEEKRLLKKKLKEEKAKRESNLNPNQQAAVIAPKTPKNNKTQSKKEGNESQNKEGNDHIERIESKQKDEQYVNAPLTDGSILDLSCSDVCGKDKHDAEDDEYEGEFDDINPMILSPERLSNQKNQQERSRDIMNYHPDFLQDDEDQQNNKQSESTPGQNRVGDDIQDFRAEPSSANEEKQKESQGKDNLSQENKDIPINQQSKLTDQAQQIGEQASGNATKNVGAQGSKELENEKEQLEEAGRATSSSKEQGQISNDEQHLPNQLEVGQDQTETLNEGQNNNIQKLSTVQQGVDKLEKQTPSVNGQNVLVAGQLGEGEVKSGEDKQLSKQDQNSLGIATKVEEVKGLSDEQETSQRQQTLKQNQLENDSQQNPIKSGGQEVQVDENKKEISSKPSEQTRDNQQNEQSTEKSNQISGTSNNQAQEDLMSQANPDVKDSEQEEGQIINSNVTTVQGEKDTQNQRSSEAVQNNQNKNPSKEDQIQNIDREVDSATNEANDARKEEIASEKVNRNEMDSQRSPQDISSSQEKKQEEKQNNISLENNNEPVTNSQSEESNQQQATNNDTKGDSDDIIKCREDQQNVQTAKKETNNSDTQQQKLEAQVISNDIKEQQDQAKPEESDPETECIGKQQGGQSIQGKQGVEADQVIQMQVKSGKKETQNSDTHKQEEQLNPNSTKEQQHQVRSQETNPQTDNVGKELGGQLMQEKQSVEADELFEKQLNTGEKETKPSDTHKQEAQLKPNDIKEQEIDQTKSQESNPETDGVGKELRGQNLQGKQDAEINQQFDIQVKKEEEDTKELGEGQSDILSQEIPIQIISKQQQNQQDAQSQEVQDQNQDSKKNSITQDNVKTEQQQHEELRNSGNQDNTNKGSSQTSNQQIDLEGESSKRQPNNLNANNDVESLTTESPDSKVVADSIANKREVVINNELDINNTNQSSPLSDTDNMSEKREEKNEKPIENVEDDVPSNQGGYQQGEQPQSTTEQSRKNNTQINQEGQEQNDKLLVTKQSQQHQEQNKEPKRGSETNQVNSQGIEQKTTTVNQLQDQSHNQEQQLSNPNNLADKKEEISATNEIKEHSNQNQVNQPHSNESSETKLQDSQLQQPSSTLKENIKQTQQQISQDKNPQNQNNKSPVILDESTSIIKQSDTSTINKEELLGQSSDNNMHAIDETINKDKGGADEESQKDQIQSQKESSQMDSKDQRELTKSRGNVNTDSSIPATNHQQHSSGQQDEKQESTQHNQNKEQSESLDIQGGESAEVIQEAIKDQASLAKEKDQTPKNSSGETSSQQLSKINPAQQSNLGEQSQEKDNQLLDTLNDNIQLNSKTDQNTQQQLTDEIKQEISERIQNNQPEISVKQDVVLEASQPSQEHQDNERLINTHEDILPSNSIDNTSQSKETSIQSGKVTEEGQGGKEKLQDSDKQGQNDQITGISSDTQGSQILPIRKSEDQEEKQIEKEGDEELNIAEGELDVEFESQPDNHKHRDQRDRQQQLNMPDFSDNDNDIKPVDNQEKTHEGAKLEIKDKNEQAQNKETLQKEQENSQEIKPCDDQNKDTSDIRQQQQKAISKDQNQDSNTPQQNSEAADEKAHDPIQIQSPEEDIAENQRSQNKDNTTVAKKDPISLPNYSINQNEVKDLPSINQQTVLPQNQQNKSQDQENLPSNTIERQQPQSQQLAEGQEKEFPIISPKTDSSNQNSNNQQPINTTQGNQRNSRQEQQQITYTAVVPANPDSQNSQLSSSRVDNQDKVPQKSQQTTINSNSSPKQAEEGSSVVQPNQNTLISQPFHLPSMIEEETQLRRNQMRQSLDPAKLNSSSSSISRTNSSQMNKAALNISSNSLSGTPSKKASRSSSMRYSDICQNFDNQMRKSQFQEQSKARTLGLKQSRYDNLGNSFSGNQSSKLVSPSHKNEAPTNMLSSNPSKKADQLNMRNSNDAINHSFEPTDPHFLKSPTSSEDFGAKANESKQNDIANVRSSNVNNLKQSHGLLFSAAALSPIPSSNKGYFSPHEFLQDATEHYEDNQSFSALNNKQIASLNKDDLNKALKSQEGMPKGNQTPTQTEVNQQQNRQNQSSIPATQNEKKEQKTTENNPNERNQSREDNISNQNQGHDNSIQQTDNNIKVVSQIQEENELIKNKQTNDNNEPSIKQTDSEQSSSEQKSVSQTSQPNSNIPIKQSNQQPNSVSKLSSPKNNVSTNEQSQGDKVLENQQEASTKEEVQINTSLVEVQKDSQAHSGTPNKAQSNLDQESKKIDQSVSQKQQEQNTEINASSPKQVIQKEQQNCDTKAISEEKAVTDSDLQQKDQQDPSDLIQQENVNKLNTSSMAGKSDQQEDQGIKKNQQDNINSPTKENNINSSRKEDNLQQIPQNLQLPEPQTSLQHDAPNTSKTNNEGSDNLKGEFKSNSQPIQQIAQNNQSTTESSEINLKKSSNEKEEEKEQPTITRNQLNKSNNQLDLKTEVAQQPNAEAGALEQTNESQVNTLDAADCLERGQQKDDLHSDKEVKHQQQDNINENTKQNSQSLKESKDSSIQENLKEGENIAEIILPKANNEDTEKEQVNAAQILKEGTSKSHQSTLSKDNNNNGEKKNDGALQDHEISQSQKAEETVSKEHIDRQEDGQDKNVLPLNQPEKQNDEVERQINKTEIKEQITIGLVGDTDIKEEKEEEEIKSKDRVEDKSQNTKNSPQSLGESEQNQPISEEVDEDNPNDQHQQQSILNSDLIEKITEKFKKTAHSGEVLDDLKQTTTTDDSKIYEVQNQEYKGEEVETLDFEFTQKQDSVVENSKQTIQEKKYLEQIPCEDQQEQNSAQQRESTQQQQGKLNEQQNEIKAQHQTQSSEKTAELQMSQNIENPIQQTDQETQQQGQPQILQQQNQLLNQNQEKQNVSQQIAQVGQESKSVKQVDSSEQSKNVDEKDDKLKASSLSQDEQQEASRQIKDQQQDKQSNKLSSKASDSEQVNAAPILSQAQEKQVELKQTIQSDGQDNQSGNNVIPADTQDDGRNQQKDNHDEDITNIEFQSIDEVKRILSLEKHKLSMEDPNNTTEQGSTKLSFFAIDPFKVKPAISKDSNENIEHEEWAKKQQEIQKQLFVNAQNKLIADQQQERQISTGSESSPQERYTKDSIASQRSQDIIGSNLKNNQEKNEETVVVDQGTIETKQPQEQQIKEEEQQSSIPPPNQYSTEPEKKMNNKKDIYPSSQPTAEQPEQANKDISSFNQPSTELEHTNNDIASSNLLAAEPVKKNNLDNQLLDGSNQQQPNVQVNQISGKKSNDSLSQAAVDKSANQSQNSNEIEKVQVIEKKLSFSEFKAQQDIKNKSQQQQQQQQEAQPQEKNQIKQEEEQQRQTSDINSLSSLSSPKVNQLQDQQTSESINRIEQQQNAARNDIIPSRTSQVQTAQQQNEELNKQQQVQINEKTSPLMDDSITYKREEKKEEEKAQSQPPENDQNQAKNPKITLTRASQDGNLRTSLKNDIPKPSSIPQNISKQQALEKQGRYYLGRESGSAFIPRENKSLSSNKNENIISSDQQLLNELNNSISDSVKGRLLTSSFGLGNSGRKGKSVHQAYDERSEHHNTSYHSQHFAKNEESEDSMIHNYSYFKPFFDKNAANEEGVVNVLATPDEKAANTSAFQNSYYSSSFDVSGIPRHIKNASLDPEENNRQLAIAEMCKRELAGLMMMTSHPEEIKKEEQSGDNQQQIKPAIEVIKKISDNSKVCVVMAMKAEKFKLKRQFQAFHKLKMFCGVKKQPTNQNQDAIPANILRFKGNQLRRSIENLMKKFSKKMYVEFLVKIRKNNIIAKVVQQQQLSQKQIQDASNAPLSATQNQQLPSSAAKINVNTSESSRMAPQTTKLEHTLHYLERSFNRLCLRRKQQAFDQISFSNASLRPTIDDNSYLSNTHTATLNQFQHCFQLVEQRALNQQRESLANDQNPQTPEKKIAKQSSQQLKQATSDSPQRLIEIQQKARTSQQMEQKLRDSLPQELTSYPSVQHRLIEQHGYNELVNELEKHLDTHGDRIIEEDHCEKPQFIAAYADPKEYEPDSYQKLSKNLNPEEQQMIQELQNLQKMQHSQHHSQKPSNQTNLKTTPQVLQGGGTFGAGQTGSGSKDSVEFEKYLSQFNLNMSASQPQLLTSQQQLSQQYHNQKQQMLLQQQKGANSMQQDVNMIGSDGDAEQEGDYHQLLSQIQEGPLRHGYSMGHESEIQHHFQNSFAQPSNDYLSKIMNQSQQYALIPERLQPGYVYKEKNKLLKVAPIVNYSDITQGVVNNKKLNEKSLKNPPSQSLPVYDRVINSQKQYLSKQFKNLQQKLTCSTIITSPNVSSVQSPPLNSPLSSPSRNPAVSNSMYNTQNVSASLHISPRASIAMNASNRLYDDAIQKNKAQTTRNKSQQSLIPLKSSRQASQQPSSNFQSPQSVMKRSTQLN